MGKRNDDEMNRARRLAAVLTCALCASASGVQAQGVGLWSMAGNTVSNTRHQVNETSIDAGNVGELTPAWSVITGSDTAPGDVSATPAVDGNHVYFPDFAGNLFKVDRSTGAVVWKRQISEYTQVPGDLARTTPAIYGDLLIFGDQGGRVFGGAKMMAVDKNTGDLAWVKQVDTHPSSIITQSATVFQNRVFVGVASVEELHAAVIPGYECCTFRGSMLALDAQTGDILWRTYTTAAGFSGNAIWGSAPSIDRNRRQVYVATGNNYSGPQSFIDCVGAAGDDADAQRACLDPYPDNHFDSVVAYDIDTGEVNWVNTVIPFDVWTIQCVFEFPSCPDPEGPDFDFGQAPMLYTAGQGDTQRDLVGVGQKSGVFWALDADDGDVVWSTQVDPGGLAGGLIWGSAYDGERIYTSSANSGYQPWVLVDGTVTYGGFYSALDPATGEILWQTANPAGYHTAGGAVTVANGVVYACSQDPDGHMYALDASSGSVEWDFVSGGSCNGGAAVVGGQVFWGSGYAGFGPPNTSNNLFYAFERP